MYKMSDKKLSLLLSLINIVMKHHQYVSLLNLEGLFGFWVHL